MIVVPFKAEHLDSMMPQPEQEHIFEWVASQNYRVLENNFAYSAFVDGRCIACAGFAEIWPDRAQGWAVLSKDAGEHMTAITKAVIRMIKIVPWRRIEIDVDCDFKAAHRWARMLGFECEAERRRAYLPDGRDTALYARVK